MVRMVYQQYIYGTYGILAVYIWYLCPTAVADTCIYMLLTPCFAVVLEHWFRFTYRGFYNILSNVASVLTQFTLNCLVSAAITTYNKATFKDAIKVTNYTMPFQNLLFSLSLI